MNKLACTHRVQTSATVDHSMDQLVNRQ